MKELSTLERVKKMKQLLSKDINRKSLNLIRIHSTTIREKYLNMLMDNKYDKIQTYIISRIFITAGELEINARLYKPDSKDSDFIFKLMKYYIKGLETQLEIFQRIIGDKNENTSIE